MKIMVVDDAAFMRLTLEKIFISAGHEVIQAKDPVEALMLYQEHKPDLVTMDITMPEMNGVEGVKKLKEIDPNARVIMISAMGQQSMVRDAIKAGALDFVVKPFQPERILTAINRAVQKNI
ncbi:MAG TPA: response regulator [Syntrophaceticus sp.]|nr:response regulator [Syntrophaceticus sp.]